MSSAFADLMVGLPDQDRDAYARMWSASEPPSWGLGLTPVILVVDMVNSFLDPAWSSSVGEDGEACVGNIRILLEAGRSVGVPIVYFTTQHFAGSAEIGAWARGRSPEEVVPFNTEGRAHEVTPLLAPATSDVVIAKAKPSAFFGTQLLSVLNYLRADSVIVTGVTTSGCVRATVVDAFSYNYRVLVPVDAVADRAPLSHRMELLHMGTRYADLAYTEDVVAQLRDNARVTRAT